MSNTFNISQRLGRTLAFALCAGLLLAAAGGAQQSAKAPANAKPPKRVKVQPGTLDKGAPAIDSPLTCGNLLVVVQDASSPQATISKVSCDHGYFVYAVPGASNPSEPSVLLFQQSGFGPDCTITVSKGSATAVLSVQQNFCGLAAGNITATVTSGSATMNGTSTGSFAASLPGLVWFTVN
jgi:hypothetical protein